MYLCNYTANNSIGIDGVKMLTKMNIPKLIRLRAGTTIFYLADCRVGIAGIKIMTKGYWGKLQMLDLRDKSIG